MINKYRKILILSFCFLGLLIFNKSQASFSVISPSKDSNSIKEQFYIDVFVDPAGESINGIDGSIYFDNKISFVRAEEGNSMINMWIEKPYLQDDGVIKFSGIIPNGFDGLINPFNPNIKNPGLLMRIIFEGINSGNSSIKISPLNITLNDGKGTLTKTEEVSKEINILDSVNQYTYKNDTHSEPEIDYKIIKDPNIFSGKYTLIFQASDKGSGIDNVSIKEGRRDWQKIESPYLLKDQYRHSKIVLQATNFYGSTVVINIDPMPYDWMDTIYVVVVILSIILIIFLVYKKYAHKK